MLFVQLWKLPFPLLKTLPLKKSLHLSVGSLQMVVVKTDGCVKYLRVKEGKGNVFRSKTSFIEFGVGGVSVNIEKEIFCSFPRN